MDAEWVEVAARIYCEQRMTDYRQAWQRAASLLGRPASQTPEDFSRVEAAVVAYQRLFGGEAYLRQLGCLRETAVQAMRWLRDFEPRLVGAVASGAVHSAHRVQLHLFADSPETVDRHFMDQSVPFEEGERRYRYARSRWVSIPLLRLETPDSGVDLAVFAWDDQRQAPLSPVTGRPVRRWRLAEVERLLSAD